MTGVLSVSKYRQAPGVDVAPLREETVLYNPSTTKFCVLNQTAAFVWDALAEPRSAAEIRDQLCAAFEGVEPQAALDDVQGVLREFGELGLLAEIAGEA